MCLYILLLDVSCVPCFTMYGFMFASKCVCLSFSPQVPYTRTLLQHLKLLVKNTYCYCFRQLGKAQFTTAVGVYLVFCMHNVSIIRRVVLVVTTAVTCHLFRAM